MTESPAPQPLPVEGQPHLCPRCNGTGEEFFREDDTQTCLACEGEGVVFGAQPTPSVESEGEAK